MVSSPLFCTHCGAANVAQAAFCYSCGQAIEIPAIASTPAISGPLQTGAVLSLATSPNGYYLASGSADETVRIWRSGQYR